MSWWAWYVLGVITIPVMWGVSLFFMAITASGFGWKCAICKKDYHWGDFNGRWIIKEFLWKWHSRFGCTVRGRKKRRAWVAEKHGK